MRLLPEHKIEPEPTEKKKHSLDHYPPSFFSPLNCNETGPIISKLFFELKPRLNPFPSYQCKVKVCLTVSTKDSTGTPDMSEEQQSLTGLPNMTSTRC